MEVPSVAGVLDARLLSLCIASSGAWMTVVVQMILPVFRPRQTRRRSPVSSTQVTTYTRSSNTIGDACPSPGILVFQAMLSDSLQCVGTRSSKLLPSPRGPRHIGQSSAWPCLTNNHGAIRRIPTHITGLRGNILPFTIIACAFNAQPSLCCETS